MTQLNAELDPLFEQVEKEGEVEVVSASGKTAVLISLEELDRLEEEGLARMAREALAQSTPETRVSLDAFLQKRGLK